MNMESLSAGLSGMYDKGYAAGVADERARHALREWDSVPDVDGMFRFSGMVEHEGTTNDWHGGPPETTWQDLESWAVVVHGAVYMIHNCEDYTRDEIRGTFRGPIPNPFEQEGE